MLGNENLDVVIDQQPCMGSAGDVTPNARTSILVGLVASISELINKFPDSRKELKVLIQILRSQKMDPSLEDLGACIRQLIVKEKRVKYIQRSYSEAVLAERAKLNFGNVFKAKPSHR